MVATARATVVEPMPVEIELLDDSAPIRVTTVRATSSRVATVVATTNSAIVEVPPALPPPQPPRSTFSLAMRSGPRFEITDKIPVGSIERPAVEVPDLPGVRLDAEIRDLRTKLGDAHFVENATPREVGDARIALEELRQQRGEVELERQRDGTYRSDKDVFVAHVARDGTVKLADRPNLRIHGLTGTFDVTDWVMRSHGMDPYASKKLEFLERTRDQRFEIGRVYRHDQLSHSPALMKRSIDSLWAKTNDPRQRKQTLFELWDECAESGDVDLVDGGAAARQMLVTFIQRELRGADAYTTDELASLNVHRRSKITFAPYE